MIKSFLEKRANFRRALSATEAVTTELKAKGYSYWSAQGSELHFTKTVAGLEMHFDVDWYRRKDGSLFVDVVGRSRKPTNFGACPRQYFVVPPPA